MTRSKAAKRFNPAIVFAILCFCALGVQPVAADQWVVPASANVSGSAGTNWRTNLRLLNTEDNGVTTRVYLLPAGADNSALDRFFDVEVPAGGQVQIDNVLASQFGFSGTAALLIDAPGDYLQVTSRTYNQVPEGTYGQFIPGVPVDQALEGGATGYLIYLAKSADYRTNLGWAGTGADAGMVNVTLFDAGGSELGSRDYAVEPFGQQQVNDIFAAVGAPATMVAYATVTASVPVVAYASVVDNRTGDPVAVLAETAPTAAADLLLQGVARASGVGNSLWRTDVRIFGTGANAGTVTLAYHPKNTEVTNPTTVPVAVGPGQLVALDDVMSSAFGMNSANGGLHITADVPLMVLARTYNQSPGGTYGQSIAADPFDILIEVGDEVSFSGVLGGAFRSNALFFNGGSSTTEVELELVAGDGTVEGARSITLLAGETNQINDVLAFFELPKSDASHTLKVSPASGGPVSAGVSVIDGDSGDPSYERAYVYLKRTDVCVIIHPPAPNREVIYAWTGKYEGEPVQGVLARRHVSAEQYEDSPVFVVETITVLSFLFSGAEVFFTTESTDIYQILDEPLLGHAELTGSVSSVYGSLGGIDFPAQVYDVTYSPPLYVGPFFRFCRGDQWIVPSVMETTTITSDGGSTTTTEPTGRYEGGVGSIDTVITTPAGSFLSVHWATYGGGGGSQLLLTEQATSIEHGVLIEQIVRDNPGGVVGFSIEAIEIGFPDP